VAIPGKEKIPWIEHFRLHGHVQSIEVGSRSFVEKMKRGLGFRAKGRKIISADDTFELWEVIRPYGKTSEPDSGNTFLWNMEP